MIDQATSLRNMASRPGSRGILRTSTAKSEEPRFFDTTRVIAVTSGKGGVGKSNLSVNLSLELAALNRRVVLLDADLALGNTDVLFGLNPMYHLGHVLTGVRTLDDVVINALRGVRLIPGGSGVEELASLGIEKHPRLVEQLQAMEKDSDFLIIDTASGIAGNVLGVLRAASEVILVTTPDPTALVDAYATIKVLHQHAPTKPVWVVVNDVVGIGEAEQIFSQLKLAVTRFLQHPIKHLGMIPRDEQLVEAVREQVPVVEYAPQSPASRAIRVIAQFLASGETFTRTTDDRLVSFWNKLVETQE